MPLPVPEVQSKLCAIRRSNQNEPAYASPAKTAEIPRRRRVRQVTADATELGDHIRRVTAAAAEFGDHLKLGAGRYLVQHGKHRTPTGRRLAGRRAGAAW